MDIVIIGTGNVATVLGRKFRAAGHRILQVVGRDSKKASELAYEWDTFSSNYSSSIIRSADLYLIAVAEEAIPLLAAELRLPGKIVAHTSASLSFAVLGPVTEHQGVFYPLQSLQEEMNDRQDIPVFIDGSDELTKKTLESLANSISGKQVKLANEKGKK